MRPVGIAVVLAAALLLAGCVAAPAPAPPTPEQVEAVRTDQARSWWALIFSGRPMPEVAVVEILPMDEAGERQSECLESADLPGVDVIGVNEWRFDGEGLADPEEAQADALEQQWICAQQFPFDESAFLLSSAQRDWLYDYFVERYEPCLRTLGFTTLGFPNRASFTSDPAGYPIWIPWEGALDPNPDVGEWRVIGQRCPLPDMLDAYNLPGTT